MVNARVYAIADKYDIPELRELAHQKFGSRLCMQTWPYHEFHVVVSEVIHSTPTNDAGIRNTILNVCAQAVDEISGVAIKESVPAADWASVLKEDPDFLLEVLRRATANGLRKAERIAMVHKTALGKRNDRHQEETNGLLQKINNQKMNLETLEKTFGIVEGKVETLIKKVHTMTCTNSACPVRFNFQPIIEKPVTVFSKNRLAYIVKCRHCKTLCL